jgi:cyclic pyranopterin phosphate synthase
MIPFGGTLGNGPALYYSVPGFRGKIGFINAVSGCFCQSCNRVRLTSDGVLKTCLHSDEGTSLLYALKQNNDRALSEHITRVIWNKPANHNFVSDELYLADQRIMSQIGG